MNQASPVSGYSGPQPSGGQLSAAEFWQLAVQSQLMTQQQAQYLQGQYQQAHGGMMPGNASQVAEWLIAQQNISRFQANVLLARQPGPFIFGDYRIYDRIEEGRLATLFRAVHVQTGFPVCLQFLAGPLAQEPSRLASVAHQASIYNGLRHDHLVRTYHFADQRNYRFIAVENLYGQSLEEMLKQHGPLPSKEACRLAWQTALGLIHLEQSKLQHGELHPANLWVNHLGTVKLISFPLHHNPLADPEPLDTGRAHDPHSRIARLADYLAPEVPRGTPLDHRAEIYSLGCILYQMLTGRPPFADQDAFRKILRHASEPPAPPHQVNPQVPQAVSQLVLYLLAKDPNQRYQRAAHVAEALTPYIDPQHLTTFADPPTQPGQQYEGWLAQRHPAAQPDEDTGEFNFNNFRAEQFQHVRNPQQEAVPSYPTASFAPPANGAGQQNGGPLMPPGGPGMAASGGGVPALKTNDESVAAALKGKSSPSKPKDPAKAAQLSAAQEEARQKKILQWTIGGVSTAVALLLGLVIFNSLGDEEPTEPNDPSAVAKNTGDPATSSTTTTPTPPRTQGGSGSSSTPRPAPSQPTVAAAGVWGEIYERGPLWQPPIAGQPEPLDIRHLPLGVQIVVSLRPAQLLADAEGRRAFASLGPWGNLIRQQIESRAGTTLENLDLVTIGLLQDVNEQLRMAVVAQPSSPVPQPQLLATLGNPQPSSVQGREVFVAGATAYHILNVGGQQKIISGPSENPADLFGDNPPVLRPQMENLLAQLDARRHVNVLFAPSFLFSGARELFTGPGFKLKDPVNEVFTVGANQFVPAGLISLHVGSEYFYSEMRIHPGNEMAPTQMANRTYDLLMSAPDRVFRYYSPPSEGEFGFVPTAANRPLLARYPKMLDAWAAYLRRTTDGKVAMVNSVLPRKAAHNLTLSTQLAVLDPGVDLSGATATAGPKTLQEKLTQIKIPLVIPRDSLDRVLDQIAQENDINIRIEGGDLQLDGITKNQSFGVNIAEPQPIAKVLQEILLQANPDKTVKSLDEENQKLVYVISPDNQAVIVTTRAKALERGTPDPVFGVKAN